MNAAKLLTLMGRAALSRTTTWNPADKSPDLTLSAGNLTASSAAFAITAVRSTTTSGAGLRCFKATLSGNSNARLVGVANSSYNLNGGVLAGADQDAAAYASDTGRVRLNGATLATLPTASSGDSVELVFNAADLLLWIRINGGDWNNSSSADPAAGTGGISLSGLNAGPYYALAGFGSVVGMSLSADFRPATPGGIVPWDL